MNEFTKIAKTKPYESLERLAFEIEDYCESANDIADVISEASGNNMGYVVALPFHSEELYLVFEAKSSNDLLNKLNNLPELLTKDQRKQFVDELKKTFANKFDEIKFVDHSNICVVLIKEAFWNERDKISQYKVNGIPAEIHVDCCGKVYDKDECEYYFEYEFGDMVL